jgi:hypothetical protein
MMVTRRRKSMMGKGTEGCVPLMGAQNKLRLEECALGMGQM